MDEKPRKIFLLIFLMNKLIMEGLENPESDVGKLMRLS